MKFKVIISLVLSCLILCGCGNSSSVGIIGGKDGPTSIIVANEAEEIVKKPLRMIKAQGKLYYDSGKVSDMSPRCGTLDGELKRSGAEYEIPRNDNECNFEGAEGYQNVTSITKEVPIDGKWVIFKLFDDEDVDMDAFKYCFCLKGHIPYYTSGDSEIAVLTEDIGYDFGDYSEMVSNMIKSVQNPDEEGYKAPETPFRILGNSDKWGISLTADDITATGLTIRFEQFGGNAAGELQTGEWFSLEVIKEDEWISVGTNPLIDYAWNSIAYKINKNDITELKVDWEWLYGKLPKGCYKLKKEIMDFRASGDFDKELYEVCFIIE